MNLLRPMRRRRSHEWLSRAAVFAGVAVGVGAGVTVAGSAPPPRRSNFESIRHSDPISKTNESASVGRPIPLIRQEPPGFVRHELPEIRQEPAVAPIRASVPVRPRRVRPTIDEGRSRRVMAAARATPAVVETILFSTDRQLAIVDGRIVGRGDDVRGGTVIDITSGAVVVRDVRGRIVRLAGK